MNQVSNSHNNEERDRFAVVLEAIQQDFKVFGESLELLGDKVNKGFERMDGKFDEMDKKFNEIDKKLTGIEAKLDSKTDQEKFDSLRDKVTELETFIKK